MRLFPSHCDPCRRTTLSAEADVRAGTAKCNRCAQSLRILPGQTYGAEDAALFEQLALAIHEAKLSRDTVAFIRRELSALSRSAPGEILSSVIAAVPGLTNFDLSVKPSRA